MQPLSCHPCLGRLFDGAATFVTHTAITAYSLLQARPVDPFFGLALAPDLDERKSVYVPQEVTQRKDCFLFGLRGHCKELLPTAGSCFLSIIPDADLDSE